MTAIDTSAAAVELHIQRCWMTDPAPERTEALLRALQFERDALKAELAEARNAALEEAAAHILKTQLGAEERGNEWVKGNNSGVKASAACIRALKKEQSDE